MNLEMKRSNTAKTASRLEEVYLNHCRKNRVKVDLKTANQSSHISGYIVGFDADSLIVEAEGSQNLIYKSGIVSICPQVEVDFIFNEAWRENRRQCPDFSAVLQRDNVHRYH
ncbi:MAG: RNA chaperone Hfq [Eubacteriales bacterium]|nr:RNA chaperone Hfq [Eubacteriales bacterium]